MKAIFIDRDGVINKDPGGWTEHDYVTKWDDFYFLPGTLEALKILKDEGIMAIVISNQAGVSKGYFTEKALYDVDKWNEGPDYVFKDLPEAVKQIIQRMDSFAK